MTPLTHVLLWLAAGIISVCILTIEEYLTSDQETMEMPLGPIIVLILLGSAGLFFVSWFTIEEWFDKGNFRIKTRKGKILYNESRTSKNQSRASED